MMTKEFNESIKEQISSYKKEIPIYEKLLEKITEIVNFILKDNMSESEYLIQGRVKSISSFADKISRKTYSNPLKDITDLCGIRVILINLEKKELFCDLIRKYFRIDLENTEDKLDKLKSQEFGYFSTHYIIQLHSEEYYQKRFSLKSALLPPKLKAEIQVRTLLEHGWAINQQNILHKREFELPKPYKRELRRVAALLEIADTSMNNIVKKLLNYESSYGAYMSHEEIINEIERLEIVYNENQDNIDLGHKIAKLAMEIDKWEKAIDILQAIYNSEQLKNAPLFKKAFILKDLGIAKCQKYKPDVNRELFEEGQKNLLNAIELNKNDSDAYAALGGTYKKLEMDYEAYMWYKKALEVNPYDPYPLVNYLVYELLNNKDVKTIIHYHRSLILRAIKKRSNQIKVLVDIPWANFDVGMLSLFLGNIDLSIHNFLMAVRLSQHSWMINTTLKTLNKLQTLNDQLPHLNLIKILLLLGICFHQNYKEENNSDFNNAINMELKNNTNLRINRADLKDPIVIISGGTDESVEKEIQSYRNNLVNAFKDFEGTIISGGTSSGICRLAGDIKEKYGEKIRLVGYSPRKIPPESNVELDKRFEHRFSNADDFSVLDVFQYWYDILRSGINPNNIKLIGINGGSISAIEFRAAIVFGAQVGIIEDSGRSANDLINDPWWVETIEKEQNRVSKKLFKTIKNSPEDIKNFLIRPFITDPDIENLQKVLIQTVNGISIYEKNFSTMQKSGDLMSGYLSALQSFSGEIGFGEIPFISARDGVITMTPFRTGDYRIYFFLYKKPSKTLAKKIEVYTKLCENELLEDFKELLQVKPFKKGKKMDKILSKVFGQEILRF